MLAQDLALVILWKPLSANLATNAAYAWNATRMERLRDFLETAWRANQRSAEEQTRKLIDLTWGHKRMKTMHSALSVEHLSSMDGMYKAVRSQFFNRDLVG